MGSSSSSTKSSFEKKGKDNEEPLVDSARKNKFEAPQYEDTDEIIWETFYHQSGVTYACMYQSGERYVLNMSTKEKYDFPKKWYNEGLLVTEDSKFMEERMSRSNEESSSEDDKSGFINHPTKGRLQTYMTEEKQYVHSYFDENLGAWVRLPMSWELLSATTKNLMKPIQETLPNWDDEYDILASLRSHNYNSDLCISTFFAWGDMSTWYNGSRKSGNSEHLLEQLNSKLLSMEENLVKQRQILNEEKSLKEEAEIKVCALQEALVNLKAQHQTLQVKYETLHKSRPKTAINNKGSCKVNKATLVNLESLVKMLRKNQMQAADDFDTLMKDLSGRLSEVFYKVSQLKLCDLDLSEELANMKTLYRKETLQRKLLYNQLQELKGNIRVFCRCRRDNRAACCLKFPSEMEIIVPNSNKIFNFNKVFGTNSTQEEVFEEAKAIITSCVDGYNVCILAYGQTGSGKTYTMQGPEDDPGVNVRSLKELLRICQSRQNLSYTLKVSMLEIYNETVHDLLSSNVSVVEIRAQGNKINLHGVNEKEVRSIEDINKIMGFGEKNRTVAATKMNSQSSRSHLVFKVTVTGEDKSTGTCSVGSLTLCDLAGSERVNKSEATGQRLVEAAAINKSLTSLGQVFNALKTAQLHIPYRNSKLTHILQPSLGGDAKACLFIMVSPDPNNLPETLSTLQFGSNAQQIELGQAKRTLTKTSPVNK